MPEDLNEKIMLVIEQNKEILKLLKSTDLTDDYQLLTIAETAPHFRVDESTLRRWVHGEHVKATKISGSTYFSKAEIKRASLEGGLKGKHNKPSHSSEQQLNFCEFIFPPASQDQWVSIAILCVFTN